MYITKVISLRRFYLERRRHKKESRKYKKEIRKLKKLWKISKDIPEIRDKICDLHSDKWEEWFRHNNIYYNKKFLERMPQRVWKTALRRNRIKWFFLAHPTLDRKWKWIKSHKTETVAILGVTATILSAFLTVSATVITAWITVISL